MKKDEKIVYSVYKLARKPGLLWKLPCKGQPTKLLKQPKNNSCGSTKSPNQNVKQICQVVHEL